MKQIYEKKINVCNHECDLKSRMKASAVLSQTQQIGIEHCNELGLTEDLNNTGTAFFVASVVIDFHADIHPDEELKITTEPFLPRRAVYHRFTNFYRPARKDPLISIDASWVMVDVQNKKILRDPPPQMTLPFINDLPDIKSEGSQSEKRKIRRAQSCTFLAEEKVTYSRCDANGHLNNAEYAGIICDHIPTEILLKQSPKTMLIAYHHEVTFQKRMQIYIAEISKHDYYFCGVKDEKKCFEANVTFA